MLRDTHTSHTDPEARLYRKCSAGAAEPSYLGHVLTENDHGLIVAAGVTEAGTRAERDAALLLDQRSSGKRRTLGADKQYQKPRFVEALRARNIVPHVAESEKTKAGGAKLCLDQTLGRVPASEVAQSAAGRVAVSNRGGSLQPGPHDTPTDGGSMTTLQ